MCVPKENSSLQAKGIWNAVGSQYALKKEWSARINLVEILKTVPLILIQFFSFLWCALYIPALNQKNSLLMVA